MTLLDQVIDDLKAGLAAIDDARTALHELGYEHHDLPPRTLIVFQQQHDAANHILDRGNALLGALTRQQDMRNQA